MGARSNCIDNEDEDHKNRKAITKHILIRTNGNK